MGISGKWMDIFLYCEEGPQLLDAYNLAVQIQDSYNKFGSPIKIQKRDYSPICRDGFVFRFKPKNGVRIENIKKRLIDVQYSLNLNHLRFSRINGILCLETFTPQAVVLDNDLKSVLNSDAYKSAFAENTIAHPIGVTEDGQAFIYDLVKYPNALISGTTLSGKSSAQKSLLFTLSKYPPEKINLLIADFVAELTMFENLPHLSAPRIRTPEDFASMFLLLGKEMDRRIWLKGNEPKTLERLPYIVCVIDEFPSFMGGLKEPKAIRISETITRILRFSRHAKIHLVLSIHEPILEIAKIRLDDIPVKLAFRAADSRKSKNILNGGNAEGFSRDGELYFKHRNTSTRLQGYYIKDSEIQSELQNMVFTPSADDSIEPIVSPRGEYGFTITIEDLERKKEEVSASVLNFPSVNTTTRNKGDDKTTLVKAVLGSLSMNAVSTNLLEKICGVATGKAKDIYEELHVAGLLGEFNHHKQRLVVPKTIDEIPIELKKLLSEYNVSDSMIEEAIAKRHKSENH